MCVGVVWESLCVCVCVWSDLISNPKSKVNLKPKNTFSLSPDLQNALKRTAVCVLKTMLLRMFTSITIPCILSLSLSLFLSLSLTHTHTIISKRDSVIMLICCNTYKPFFCLCPSCCCCSQLVLHSLFTASHWLVTVQLKRQKKKKKMVWVQQDQ